MTVLYHFVALKNIGKTNKKHWKTLICQSMKTLKNGTKIRKQTRKYHKNTGNFQPWCRSTFVSFISSGRSAIVRPATSKICLWLLTKEMFGRQLCWIWCFLEVRGAPIVKYRARQSRPNPEFRIFTSPFLEYPQFTMDRSMLTATCF